MNCHELEPLLTSYVLGDLDAARADEVRHHLETCSDCRAAVRELESTLDLLRPALAADPNAPAHLEERRRERLHHPRVPAPLLWLTEHRPVLLQTAVALVIVCLVTGVLFSSVHMAMEKTDRSAGMARLERRDAPHAKSAMQVAMLDKNKEEAERVDTVRARQSDLPQSVEPPPVQRSVARAAAKPRVTASGIDGAESSVAPAAPAEAYQVAQDAKDQRVETGHAAPAGLADSGDMVNIGAGVRTAPSSEAVARDEEFSKKLTELAATPANEGAVGGKADADGLTLNALNVADDLQGALVMKGQYAGRGAGGRAGALGSYAGAYGQHTEESVVKSLDWLKQNQAADGSWNHAEPGVASLGLLAFLAHGETPSSEKYGENVEKTIRYILGRQSDAGTFSDNPDEHALATYAVSEAYGLTRIPELKMAMDKAVNVIVDRTLAGENPGDAWAAPALKASQLAGAENSKLSFAMEAWGQQIANNDSDPSSALSLQLMNRAQAPVTQEKLKQLKDVTFDWNSPRSLEEWLRIGEAKFHEGGPVWSQWNSKMPKTLIAAQNTDGSWPARPESPTPFNGPAASTALSALSLETYYRFLPTLKPIAVQPLEPPTNDDVKVETEPATKPVFRAYGVNPYVETATNRFSTFAIDVDTASYTLARRYMREGTLPPPEAVRTEEFINFFDYGYKRPERDAFAIQNEVAPSAFGPGYLLKIGVVGRNVSASGRHEAVLTLVIDTSGSMDTPDRLGLVRESVKLMIDRLSPNDRIAIVQYDSHARLALEHTPVSEKEKILAALDGLQTSGSTHLEEGITLGYNVADQAFKTGAINRVIIMSDGVANLGSASATNILAEVASSRQKGILCSVFGFGKGTYDDTMLETLANKGDGTYQFIDSSNEAHRAFVDNLSATLDVVATDVKIQVEFNPNRAARFRQLGYENRQLKTEDFRNDAVDAGEVGTSQSVTALYQLDLAGDPTESIGTVHVRFRDAISGQVQEMEKKIMPSDLRASFDEATPHFKLAASVAEFAEILRGSPYAEGASFDDVAKMLSPVALDLTNDPQVQELLSLVHAASSLPRANE